MEISNVNRKCEYTRNETRQTALEQDDIRLSTQGFFIITKPEGKWIWPDFSVQKCIKMGSDPLQGESPYR